MKNLSESIYDWLQNYKKNSVKPTTYNRLAISYHTLLRHPISQVSIGALSMDDLQNYVNDLVEDGYSLSTIKKQYFLIRAYLEYAVTKGLFRLPIYNGVLLPSQSMVKKKRKDVGGYTTAEQMRLIPVLCRGDHITWLAAVFMIETGVRVGECLALDWTDVLWERRALRVNKTIIRVGYTNHWVVQDSAKSYTSNRIVPLSTKVLSLLTGLQSEQKRTTGFIFSNNPTKPTTYESIRWYIQKACREADVPYLGQHVFRHTFATNCYYRGCDVKILSKLLGHADVSVTYNVYVHLFGDALEDMRSVIE